MYCPVEMMSPFLIFDIKAMNRKRVSFVSFTILCSTISLYTMKECISTVSKGTWKNVDQHHS